MPKNCSAILLALALFLLLPTTVAGAECQFVLGFKTLRDLVGHDIVGACLENEHHGANGDSLQQTTGGLLVWRKLDNWTAFTDGYRTWVFGPNGLEQRLNSERFLWETEYMIAALPQNPGDPIPVEKLRELAEISSPVFLALLERFGDKPLNSTLVNDILNLTRADRGVALQIVKMPFLQASTLYKDYVVLRHARRLVQIDPDGLRQVLSHTSLSGGITDDTVTTFLLLGLGLEQPETAAAIQALPWVSHGAGRRAIDNLPRSHEARDELEEGVVRNLIEIAQASRDVGVTLARKPWLLDGLAKWEEQVVLRLSWFVSGHPGITLDILNMPFLETSATAENASTLDALFTLIQARPNSRQDLRALLAHPWLQGGIRDGQRATVELLAIGKRSPEIAAVLDTLPWVQDGIDDSEKRAVSTLFQLSQTTRDLLPALTRKPWVQDGLTSDEQDALMSLSSISFAGVISSRQDESAALAILEMPFLDDFDEGIDSAVVKSLSILHWAPERSYLRQVLSHATLRNGIGDENKSLVAVLHSVVQERPGLLESLLDPRKTFVEERTIVLPRAGEVLLAVVHTRPGTFRTMDILENSLRVQEEFMQEAFPKKFVGLLVADATDAAGGGGAGGIIIDPGGEEDVYLIAHELAHTYWAYGKSWIVEGGAEVLAMVSGHRPLNRQNMPWRTCFLARSLSEIERIDLQAITDGSQIPGHFPSGNCPYILGLGLFVDLYESLGDQLFRQGFRNLYLKLKSEELGDVCYGTEWSLCYTKAAFLENASPEAAANAEHIINHWYYGSEHGGQ